MNKSKKITYEDFSTEPINIHCYCNICNKKIVLPEKVWLKRGAICSACYHRVHKIKEDIYYV